MACSTTRSPPACCMSEGGLLSGERASVYDRAMFPHRPASAAAARGRPARRAGALHAGLATLAFLCACGDTRETELAPAAIEASMAAPSTPPTPIPVVSVQARAQTVAPAHEPSRFVLLGTAISPGASFAMVQDEASRQIYRISPGDRLEGMLVRKVESSRVVMSTAASGADSAARTMTIEQKAAPGHGDEARPPPAVAPGPAPQPYYVEPDDPPSNH